MSEVGEQRPGQMQHLVDSLIKFRYPEILLLTFFLDKDNFAESLHLLVYVVAC